jgi:serine/threonine protein kinase
MPVDPDRVQAIFLLAVEMPDAAARAVVLQRECGADAELRLRVEALLAAHGASGSSLDRDLGPALSSILRNEAQPGLPQKADTIGGYEILDKIGRGSGQFLYKARDLKRLAVVALRIVAASPVASSGLANRLVADAQALAALDHQHIVKVLQVGECAAGLYFVREWIDGLSLEEVRRQGHPDMALVIQWLIPVAEAVHYAHGRGIVHGQLKPANILLGNTHRPLVTDFGMARLAQRVASPFEKLRTPIFLPPEQAGVSAIPVGPHSDVYSLGAILYALVTGTAPFNEESVASTLLRVRSAEPPTPVRSLCPEVPDGLEWICHRCLKKQPGERFRTAHDLAVSLQHFADGYKHAVPGHGPPANRVDAPLSLVALKTGKVIAVSRSDAVVGRSPECDVILDGPEVSRRHCRISIVAGQVFLEDLGSTCGTYVNGVRVERISLRDGDRVDFAGQPFHVRISPPNCFWS